LGILVVGLLLALFALAPAGDGLQTPADEGAGPPDGVVPDNYVVVLQAGASAEGVAGAHGLTRRFTYSTVFNGFAAFIPPGRVNAVKSDSRVQSVTADRIMSIADKPDGPGAQGKPGGGGDAPSQVVPPNITRVRGSASQTGSGVGVAIVDTGVGPQSDLTIAAAFFDAFGGDGSDGNGHGTHVAGIATAKNNTVDVVGVAPDATVYSVRVLDSSGSGSDSSVIAGLDWIAANASALGIRVANASLGRAAAGAAADAPVCNAVQAVVNANVTFTAAAGNDPNIETT
jgi:subtilisin family serine protease